MFLNDEKIMIYKKIGSIFNSYRVKVIGSDKKYTTVIDLDDNNTEKTFNNLRILETFNKNISKEDIKKRLEFHINEYHSRKLPSSFTHGGIFSRAKGYIDKNGHLFIDLRGSKRSLERDIKVFKLIIYHLRDTGPVTMGGCKRFFKGILKEFFNKEFDNDEFYDFTNSGKKDIKEGLKFQLNDLNETLKDQLYICEEENINPKEDDYIKSLKQEILDLKDKIKRLNNDYREILVEYICMEYYTRHDNSIFYDLMQDFSVLEKN